MGNKEKEINQLPEEPGNKSDGFELAPRLV